MTAKLHTRYQIFVGLVAGISLGCICGSLVIIGMITQSTVQPVLVSALRTATFTPTKTATPTNTAVPTITLAPTATTIPTRTPLPTATATPNVTATPTETRTPSPTRTLIPTKTPRPSVQHFIVGRPVAPTAQATIPAVFYLYGTTGQNTYDVHHGEEFVNPTGTAVYAVEDGVVVVSGSDTVPVCGDEQKSVCGRELNPPDGYYGKLVILQIAQDYNGQRVYALYGHLSGMNVDVGDLVSKGDQVGFIGMTGVALGPHLHFEIRLGVNDYAHTRNPILWMQPLPGRGSIAGRYVDSKGALVRAANVSIFRADPDTFLYSTETYSRDKWPAVNGDEVLDENFAMPDLTPGDYIIRIPNTQFAARVTVESGKLSFVEIGGP